MSVITGSMDQEALIELSFMSLYQISHKKSDPTFIFVDVPNRNRKKL